MFQNSLIDLLTPKGSHFFITKNLRLFCIKHQNWGFRSFEINPHFSKNVLSSKLITFFLKFVGDNVKCRISKRVLQENKERQIFQKTNIAYPLIRTRACAYQGVRNVCFSENVAFFVLRLDLLPYYRRVMFICLNLFGILTMFHAVLTFIKILR